MWRFLAGGITATLLVILGFLFFRTGAEPGKPLFRSVSRMATALLPNRSNAGPPPIDADTQKQFDHYDTDYNGAVSQTEYHASPHKSFAKLDTNHDGQLSFSEWATSTLTKFAKADADHSGSLSAAEFSTIKVATKPKPKPTPVPTKPGKSAN